MLTIRTTRCQVSSIVFTDDSRAACMDTLQNDRAALIIDKRIEFDIPQASTVVRLRGGESAKRLSVADRVSARLLRDGIDRKSVIVAVGGGSITDLAGFVASVYMRGIRYVSVPTTLLAMADAAIGGKTGVNSRVSKNAIGSFHLPDQVIIDTGFLKTLSKLEMLNGFGEMLKCAVITGGELRNLCERGIPGRHCIGRAISLAAKCKVELVNRDPFDSSVRAILNLGHTAGHAIEAAERFRIPHGRAVTIGLIIESRVGEFLGITRRGFSAEFENAAKRAGFKTNYNKEKAADRIVYDKKKAADKIVLALPRDWGRIEFPVTLPIVDFARICQSATGF